VSASVLRAPPGEWLAEEITAGERQQLYEGHVRADAEAAGNSRAIRWGGYIVGGIGAFIGLAGIGCATLVFGFKEAKPPQFVLFDAVSHTTAESVPATAAAARLFGQEQAEHDLRSYVEAREMWQADTADLSFHRIAVMSTPDEQAKLAADWSPKNPLSPQVRYGRNTGVRVDNLRFARSGIANGVQVWFVRFRRTVITGGVAAPAQERVATVTFAWHPEMAMADEADRAINLSGFQCLTYSVGAA